LNQALKLIKTPPLFEHAVGCLTELAAGLRISAKFELNSGLGPAAASQPAANSYDWRPLVLLHESKMSLLIQFQARQGV
jgi:hypothetical protein